MFTLNEASLPKNLNLKVEPKSTNPYDGNLNAPALSGCVNSESVIE